MRYLLLFFVINFFSPEYLNAQCDDCDDYAFLGIYSNSISKKKAEKLGFDNDNGSYVTSVIGNTAAEKTGLQPFDYIYGIDAYRTDYDRPLTAILKKYEPGDKVNLHFYRNGKKQSKTVELGKRSDAKRQKRSREEDPFLGVEQNHKAMPDDINGVRINVIEKSSAANLGLEDGDIVTKVNGFPILDWHDMGAAIDMLKVGETIKVDYIRDNKTHKGQTGILSLADTKPKNAFAYNFNPNFDFNFSFDKNNENWNRPFSVEKRDVAGMSATLSDIPESELESIADELRFDLSASSTLSIQALSLNPNPDKGLFELQFQLSSRGNTVVDIYNSDGRNIYNYERDNFSGTFEDQVDISQNGTGVYYLRIAQAGKQVVKKVVLTAL